MHRNLVVTAAAAAILSGTASCATTPGSPNQTLASSTAMSSVSATTDLGPCAEIDSTKYQRGSLGTNAAIDERKQRTIVAVENIGAGSHIGISGNESCLIVTGNVGPDVHISVSGDDSGVTIYGYIDVTSGIEVPGNDSTAWLPNFQLSTDIPDLRINGNGGSRLIVDGTQVVDG